MRKEFLMDTIGQAKDTYVMEAGMEVKAKRTGKRFWKVLAAAALIPALVLTAYATDFLNIKALLSGPERFRSESYSQMGRAMDKAGFQIDAKERFANGYAFSEVQVSNTSPNLDNAILVQTAFITIANTNTVRTHAAGALKLLECFATIFRMILAKRLDFILMLICIFLVIFRLCQNSDVGLLVNICWLTNANAITLISMLCL